MTLQNARKRQAPTTGGQKMKGKRNVASKTRNGDEELLSSEFEDDDDDRVPHSPVIGDADSSDEDETAQEKRLRLTKDYLEKLKTYTADDAGSDEEKDVVGEKLQEEILQESGKLQKPVADTCTKPQETDFQYFRGHRLPVTAVVVSSDASIMFSASKDCSIIKWNFSDKKKLAVIKGGKKFSPKTNHQSIILALALSSDCKYLASAGNDKNIHIWDAETCNHLHAFRGHRNHVSGLAFRLNTHMLFSSSYDYTVKLWNLDVMGYVETLFGHQNAVLSCDSFVRDRCVTAGGRDNTVRIWKIPEESQLPYHGNNSSIECVRFINEDYLVSGNDEGMVNIWNVNKKKPIVTIKSAHAPKEGSTSQPWISAVGALRNTDLIATGSCDGLIRVWKCTERFIALLPLLEIPVEGFVNDIQFTNNGYLVAAIGQEHRLGRWSRIKSARNRVMVVKIF